jgi:hypothetical protein
MNPTFAFLASGTGRIVRAVAGLILIAVGLFVSNGTAGIVLMVVGLIPLLAGIFDVCVFAPLFSLPFGGAKLRTATIK